MKPTITNHTTEPLLLMEERTACAEHSLTYRFLALPEGERTRFLITAETADDTAQGEIHAPLPVALSYFQSVTSGKVMPCTLLDVLSDLQYLENF